MWVVGAKVGRGRPEQHRRRGANIRGRREGGGGDRVGRCDDRIDAQCSRLALQQLAVVAAAAAAATGGRRLVVRTRRLGPAAAVHQVVVLLRQLVQVMVLRVVVVTHQVVVVVVSIGSSGIRLRLDVDDVAVLRRGSLVAVARVQLVRGGVGGRASIGHCGWRLMAPS